MSDQTEPGFNDLVRVRIGDVEKNMGRVLAEASDDVEILEDEPIRTDDGRLREETRVDGRPVKPKTTVAKKAAAKRTAKKAAAKKAATPAVDPQVAVTPSADDKKEQDQ